MSDLSEIATISFSILKMTPVCKGKLAALADVEVAYEGVSFTICGLQVLASPEGTAITLPKYRDALGECERQSGCLRS